MTDDSLGNLTPTDHLRHLGSFIREALTAAQLPSTTRTRAQRKAEALRIVRLLTAVNVANDELMATFAVEALNNGSDWGELAQAADTWENDAFNRWRFVDRDHPTDTNRAMIVEVKRELGSSLGQLPFDGGPGI
jgi:hypothetical protein